MEEDKDYFRHVVPDMIAEEVDNQLNLPLKVLRGRIKMMEIKLEWLERLLEKKPSE